jgi:hypothetical protein
LVKIVLDEIAAAPATADLNELDAAMDLEQREAIYIHADPAGNMADGSPIAPVDRVWWVRESRN